MTAEIHTTLEAASEAGSRFAAVKELETRAAELRTQLAELNRRAADKARADRGEHLRTPVNRGNHTSREDA